MKDKHEIYERMEMWRERLGKIAREIEDYCYECGEIEKPKEVSECRRCRLDAFYRNRFM